jgi:nucleoside 2-deoxyribosyltransferase
MILHDIAQGIVDAQIVIAEITPANQNVFYELGYAHALAKPTILLAERGKQPLPFDISGYRVLFYDNTIAGKKQVEDGLKKHLQAILRD